MLVEAGADVHAVNAEDNTPMLLSAAARRVGVMQIMLGAGGDVNRPGGNVGRHCTNRLIVVMITREL